MIAKTRANSQAPIGSAHHRARAGQIDQQTPTNPPAPSPARLFKHQHRRNALTHPPEQPHATLKHTPRRISGREAADLAEHGRGAAPAQGRRTAALGGNGAGVLGSQPHWWRSLLYCRGAAARWGVHWCSCPPPLRLFWGGEGEGDGRSGLISGSGSAAHWGKRRSERRAGGGWVPVSGSGSGSLTLGLFPGKVAKIFYWPTSHKILGYMHGVLNIIKKYN